MSIQENTAFGVVMLAGGRGSRMKSAESKQFLLVAGKPILVHALERFEEQPETACIVLVAAEGELERCRHLVNQHGIHKVTAIVQGGAERQDSVACGLKALPAEVEWVMVHDAARPFAAAEDIRACAAAAVEEGAAILAVPVKDTIKTADARRRVTATPDRSTLWAVQTPQAFRRRVLEEAHAAALDEGCLGTDDASLVERIGGTVRIVPGSYENIKITTPEDLQWAEAYAARAASAGKDPAMIRIGQGFDVHAFEEGRKCIIGGVDIPFEKGLAGHSDADVLLHAVADAILGALALGDIGKHFPDTDAAYKDADSIKLLEHVWALAIERGYRLGNLDATVIAQRPKMAPHIPAIVEVLARTLHAEPGAINVKATTTEKLGFTGREEGVAAQAVVCLFANVLS
ncbi:2-C-methyl-D-erythritol 4-phosphate cytidylyltransferase [Gorillibacterium sp. CAU 1737]|uniref:2-C-methyl-D-erythritol 4-phosphate cytidylyltransferase n=1 Tax=Gorillibacterium sp. CAU 1737 TaxID=3140362 RepID=UPI00326131B3